MKQKTVLIADDDAAFLRMLTVRCKHLGLDVRQASDAMQALVMVHKDPPDLIIMDVAMPAGDGVSATRMLASDPRLARIPVIILTGKKGEQVRRHAEAAGARYLLKSPDYWVELKALLCGLLGLPGEGYRVKG